MLRCCLHLFYSFCYLWYINAIIFLIWAVDIYRIKPALLSSFIQQSFTPECFSLAWLKNFIFLYKFFIVGYMTLVRAHKAVVDSEEGHLTRLVEQVGKSYEGVGRVQVQDQHCSNEWHSLHLNTHTQFKQIQAKENTAVKCLKSH